MSELATEQYEPIYDTFDSTVISEMASGAGVLLPLSQEVIDSVAQDDDDPKFVTFLIESGWSKQKRYWGPTVFESIQEQVNNAADPIVGYLGHIPPDQDGYAFPDIQLQWLKSKLQVSSDKVKMLVKAYVLPQTKGRDYLKRGLVRSVSWRGNCLLKPIQGGVEVKDFKLESIDLSRPGKAGMQAALIGGLTSEVEEGRNDVKPDEIKALQENELRAHNPELVLTIESTAKKPLETKVSEQEATIEDSKSNVDLVAEIRKLLGISEDGDVLEVLSKTMDQLRAAGRTAKDAILDAVLEKKFKGDEQKVNRGLVKRLLASEMDKIELDGNEAKDREAVESKVNEMIEGDSELKEIVAEMQDTHDEEDSGRSVETSNGDRKARKIEDGYANDRIAVRKARR